LIELVLIVRLSSAPERCEQIYLRQEVPVSMMQCLFNGAKQAARRTEDHPGYMVKRWNYGHPRA
jgi:hypothetical protein